MYKNPQTNSSSQLHRPKFTCNLLKIPPPQKKTGSSAILGGYAPVLSKAWMNRRAFPDPPKYYRPLLRILIYLLQLQSQKSTTDNKKTTIRKNNTFFYSIMIHKIFARQGRQEYFSIFSRSLAYITPG